MPEMQSKLIILLTDRPIVMPLCRVTCFKEIPMSTTVMLPSRVSLIAALLMLVNTIGDVLSAAYTRADDIEPFGL